MSGIVAGSEIVAVVLALAAVAGPVAGLALLARRVRRRGGSGGYSLMGPFDELWHPAAVAARIEVQVQDERQEPAPSPGDRLHRPLPRLAAVGGDLPPPTTTGAVGERHDHGHQRHQRESREHQDEDRVRHADEPARAGRSARCLRTGANVQFY
ncbi:hypothetical protein GCM10017691_45710 [Pseudonocardia petroleophila]|uniref:Uncharacterized protein n=1 Tax=Pseudonocardia petroleophila TaxID=37331 RepID=A0A7G7MQZ8_9PSEU|nr:hypothetical protein [Pseudonocardia petroleophila]QNG55209.1 hypothetical protein H6H00_15920 [Pseudonocardia petroleophila]